MRKSPTRIPGSRLGRYLTLIHGETNTSGCQQHCENGPVSKTEIWGPPAKSFGQRSIEVPLWPRPSPALDRGQADDGLWHEATVTASARTVPQSDEERPSLGEAWHRRA